MNPPSPLFAYVHMLMELPRERMVGGGGGGGRGPSKWERMQTGGKGEVYINVNIRI